jgi:hypothetical protein
VSDIVTRLRRWTHAVDAEPASDLMDQAAVEIENLRTAIRRVADQDATLSVCRGNVTVDLDGTLTDAEREAVDRVRIAFRDMDHNDMTMQQIEDYEAICDLLERTK